jgi:tetratricopeptide (TPR) repeat protein
MPQKSLSKLVLGLGLVTGLLLAHSQPCFAANEKIAKTPLKFGEYLAGRHAQFIQDPTSAIKYYRENLRANPNNLEVQTQLFTILLAEGRIKEALSLAVTLDKTNAAVRDIVETTLIVQNVRIGNFTAAANRVAGFPEEGLGTLSLPLIKAWVLAGEKKYAEAGKALDERNSNPGMAVLLGPHIALIYEISGDRKKAEEAYQSAIKARGGAGLRLSQLLGEFYERAGENEKAKKVYQDYLKTSPQSVLMDSALDRIAGRKSAPLPKFDAKFGMAEAMFSLSRSIQRQSPLEALIFSNLALYLQPNFGLVKFLVADNFYGEGRFKEALKVQQSLAKDPTFGWSARLRQSRTLYALDRLDDAVKLLRSMANEEKSRIDALVQMGELYRSKQNYKDAAAAFEEAKKRITKFEPHHWQLLFWNGAAHERLKKWPQAEKDFLKALELNPNEPQVLNYLGYSWVEQGKNMERARKMIESAVKQQPRAGYIVDSLGWVLYRMGDMKGAVKNLERAVLLTPHDPTINDHLGDAYWRANRKIEARFQWERALTLDPEKDQIPIIKKKLKEGLPNS